MAHLVFWAVVDATGTNDEAPVANAVIVGMESSVIALVCLLAVRAGKQRNVALAWGLGAAAATAAIYALFAIIALASCNDCVG